MKNDDAVEFYTTLVSVFDAVREEIKQETDLDDITVCATSVAFSARIKHRPSIIIRNSSYGNEKIEVEGYLLSDLVAEFIRRVRFSNKQNNLQIGPPTIEIESESESL